MGAGVGVGVARLGRGLALGLGLGLGLGVELPPFSPRGAPLTARSTWLGSGPELGLRWGQG